MEKTEVPAGQNAPSETAEEVVASAKTEKKVESRLALVKHAPFEAGECDACHDPSRGNKLFSDPEKLCFRCHEDFAEEYKWVHGPAAVGFCNTCHAPHESRNQWLLLSTSSELCLKCHREEDVTSQPYHKFEKGTICTQCHDPHGGDDRWLLKEKGDVQRPRLPEKDDIPPTTKTEDVSPQDATSEPNSRNNNTPSA